MANDTFKELRELIKESEKIQRKQLFHLCKIVESVLKGLQQTSRLDESGERADTIRLYEYVINSINNLVYSTYGIAEYRLFDFVTTHERDVSSDSLQPTIGYISEILPNHRYRIEGELNGEFSEHELKLIRRTSEVTLTC